MIDTDVKQWNSNLIHQLFSNAQAADILNTPLVLHIPADNLIWKGEKNGIYSVKSAYRLCVQELIDVSHLRRPGNWNVIWNLKAPPKIQNFLWHVCRGCLPTRAQLQSKGVECPVNCVSCNAMVEDLAHVFFHCPFAVQTWQVAGLWHTVMTEIQQSISAEAAIFSLLQTLHNELQQRFAAVLWSLWKHRNNKLWQNENETAAQVIFRA